jgi:hypothetical protein
MRMNLIFSHLCKFKVWKIFILRISISKWQTVFVFSTSVLSKKKKKKCSESFFFTSDSWTKVVLVKFWLFYVHFGCQMGLERSFCSFLNKVDVTRKFWNIFFLSFFFYKKDIGYVGTALFTFVSCLLIIERSRIPHLELPLISWKKKNVLKECAISTSFQISPSKKPTKKFPGVCLSL